MYILYYMYFLHAIVLSHCKYLYILKEDPREDWTVSNWAFSLNKVIIIFILFFSFYITYAILL